MIIKFTRKTKKVLELIVNHDSLNLPKISLTAVSKSEDIEVVFFFFFPHAQQKLLTGFCVGGINKHSLSVSHIPLSQY